MVQPLVEDQIHVPGFLKACTHIWSDDVSRENKSGVFDYYFNISKEFGLPLVDFSNLPDKGVIFVGMCHLLEEVFKSMPQTGSYIIVHRTNDRPFTPEMYALKPASIKHIYTVDCRVRANDVTAIPFGNASINGEDHLIKEIAKEEVEPAENKIFCRYNVNLSTPHRNESLSILKSKPFAKVIEEQIPADEFFRQVKAHKFTMSLAGCGADASRQWSAIQLGSIPIVTDCVEMRFFEDLPLVYCPENMNDITEEWLSRQDVSTKSTERMRMSYWINHINEMKKTL